MERIDAVDGVLEIDGKKYKCRDGEYEALALYLDCNDISEDIHTLVYRIPYKEGHSFVRSSALSGNLRARGEEDKRDLIEIKSDKDKLIEHFDRGGKPVVAIAFGVVTIVHGARKHEWLDSNGHWCFWDKLERLATKEEVMSLYLGSEV